MKKNNLLTRNLAALALLVSAVAGCSAIKNAREAQREVSGRAQGVAAAPAVKVDLTDRKLSWLVDFALTNRPSLVSAKLAVEDARLRLKQLAADAPIVSSTPWTSWKASANGAYSVSSESARHLDQIEFSSDGDVSAGVSVSVLLYDFGRYGAAAEAAAEDLVAAEINLVDAGYEVFEEVSAAYFSVQERAVLLQVALTNEFEFAEHLRQAKDRLDAGEAQQLDVTRARLDYSQSREATVAASNELVTAGAELLCALGLETGRGDFSELLPEGGEALATVSRAFGNTSFTVGEAFDSARTNSPSMVVSRARLRAAAADVDYAVADLMPSISASTSLDWTSPMWIWRGAVDISQSLFQGFRKTTAVDRSVVSMRQAAATVDEQEQILSRSLEVAIAGRDNAVKALDTANASVVDARENLKTVKAQYFEGDADRIEFTAAVAAYTKALGNRVSAFYAGQRAEARLFRITGRKPVWTEVVIKEEK
jgi:outer membrane protein